MSRGQITTMAAVALAGLFAGPANLPGGEEGVARIVDGRNGNIQTTSFGHYGGPPLAQPAHSAPYGYDYGYGYGFGACPNCKNGKHCPNCYWSGFFKQHCCTHSADHGYSVPAKHPLNRLGVQYQHFWPAKWYGAGGTFAGGYPMVYQPTDTTQLGYYYQHAPFWQPNPQMIPPRPVPAQWHIYAPVVEAWQISKHGAPCEYIIDVVPVDGSSSQGPPPSPTDETDPVPPAPQADTAGNLQLRQVPR